MENGNYLYSKLTNIVIKKFYNVYNELGFGFLEKVYQNALYFELISLGLAVETQKEIDVYYKDKVVGKYYADMLVNDVLVLELKAVEQIVEAHELQLINYLKATDVEIGLLLNFGKKPEVHRKIFTNDRKKRLI
ncbi:GxxExxY protein [Pinibacter aurantiacus]|uniref:GxxExxY protein n=1 Tax=Pinibacter aurantiacus TaxID=2851599 RepID=A0A9E2W7S5_9BACT|nr:GxxExxY protein [Pinibacter aurantiacus]MBV4356792.1 GxxExxY protein [Pinibacter aurantiacus]